METGVPLVALVGETENIPFTDGALLTIYMILCCCGTKEASTVTLFEGMRNV